LDIANLQTNWDQLGRTDPFWAILSVPEKIHGQWDARQFFSTGVDEINGVLQYLKGLGVEPVLGNALDFGCGVGRLTQAMCRHFEHCCGIDIAPSMIDLAGRYNEFGMRCRYHLNESDALEDFQDNSWHFIYSNLVLQHMKPEYSKRYIREFFRVLSPDGILIFQLPAEPKTPVTMGAQVRKLSDTGFRASLAPAVSMLTATPASRIEVPVVVRNISSQPWPAAAVPESVIALGNHWLTRTGEPLLRDDGRTPLPVTLGPGEQIELRLAVETPREPGDYILEFDMVQEFVAWFADKGSDVARIPVSILPESVRVFGPAKPVEQSSAEPIIEMYGVPKQEVLDIIATSGGLVVDLQEDLNAGAEWTSFRYCVKKERP
jgi:ubiquinone/menaquinone biosynthesis C-methylase UbiE